MIPYGRQNISQDDIDSMVSVLRSSYLTQGPEVARFEQALCDYCHADYAVAVNSATSALHLACLALGVGPDDHVWTSPISFVASANCALYCGAKVDFVDVEENSGLMSVSSLREKLAIADQQGTLPKVIIPVHYSGQSCDMKSIRQLAKKYGFHVIEDASHALGARYLDENVGSCRYSDICVFSFHPVKMLTTGEGGAALCNGQKNHEKMQRLRSHGIVKDGHAEPWAYQQIDLGYNYRMSDMAASLGISQIKRLDLFLEKRRLIATKYNEAINNSLIRPIVQSRQGTSSFHLYPVLLKDSDTRRAFYDYLLENGITGQVHYIPIFKQPYYQSIKGNWPQTESFYQKVLSIPIFYDLSEADQEKVVKVVNRFS